MIYIYIYIYVRLEIPPRAKMDGSEFYGVIDVYPEPHFQPLKNGWKW